MTDRCRHWQYEVPRHTAPRFGALVCLVLLAGNSIANDIVIIVGAEGTREYGQTFHDAAMKWQGIAESNDCRQVTIGLGGPADDRQRLMDVLKELADPKKDEDGDAPIWVIMLGHGTYADGVAKFNLRGKDVSASELAEWIAPITRPMVFVNGSSSSGPFVNRLSGQNRVVVTGTKSGSEQNFTRFGGYFAEAMASKKADLDHDDEISVTEAFLLAARNVASYYDSEGRISTEHALIDDNGDSAGTPFKLLLDQRMSGKAATKDNRPIDGKLAAKISLSPDGKHARLTEPQRRQRDELESKLRALQSKRDQMPEDEYLAEITPIMLDLAKLYHPDAN